MAIKTLTNQWAFWTWWFLVKNLHLDNVGGWWPKCFRGWLKMRMGCWRMLTMVPLQDFDHGHEHWPLRALPSNHATCHQCWPACWGAQSSPQPIHPGSPSIETQDIQQELAPLQVFRTLFDPGTVPSWLPYFGSIPLARTHGPYVWWIPPMK